MRRSSNNGASIWAYTPPVPGRWVIGLDALGPVRATTYPGDVWMEGPGRATLTPADGRRGPVWGVGAVEPATGLATTLCRPRRDRASFMPLLELVLQTYPARQWVLIADTVTTQVSRETQAALLAWPEVPRWWLPQ